jgi:hypothetical protein
LVARDINIPGLGTNDAVLRMRDSFLFGLGSGTDDNENRNLNGDVVCGAVKYDAMWGSELTTGRVSMFDGNLGADYNFLSGAFTPIVSGGIGFPISIPAFRPARPMSVVGGIHGGDTFVPEARPPMTIGVLRGRPELVCVSISRMVCC